MKKLTKEEVLRIVRELHDKLDVIYGDRLKGVYLYGSYARGDAREDSDIDVAVVLVGEVDSWDERDRMGDIISDICLREDCLIMTMFISESEYREQPFSLHRNIAEEGIPA
jgi:hypothetical protein